MSRGDEMEITWSGPDGTVVGSFTADFVSGGAVYTLGELGLELQDKVDCSQIPRSIRRSQITLRSTRSASSMYFREGSVTPAPARVRATNVTLGDIRTAEYDTAGTGINFPRTPYGYTYHIRVELLDDQDQPVASLDFPRMSGFSSGTRLIDLDKAFRVPANPRLSLGLDGTFLLTNGGIKGYSASGAFDTVSVWNKTRDIRVESQILADGDYHTPDLSVSRGDEMEITWSGHDGTVTGTFTADFVSGGAVYTLGELGLQFH